MYSVVLATMLAAGSTTPAWHSCHGCHGCGGYPGYRQTHSHHHHGSYGCSSCYSCYSSCSSCFGCSSCYSCYSGYSGYSGYAGYACSCSCSCYISYGCNGCSGYTGCCGGTVSGSPQVVPVPASNPEVEALRKEVRELREKLKQSEKIPVPKGKEPVSAPTATARVTVSLPGDARLWVENVECPLTSTVRSFNTPALDANQRYVYNLTMQVVRNGQAQRETQRVIVIPGQEVNVNFNGSNAVTTAAR